MERSYLLLTGALSGLVSLLAHSVLWSIAEMLHPRLRIANASNRQLDVPDIFLHLFAGIGLGGLFWISWGLAALVDVTWWQRGLIFGGITSVMLATPAVISTGRAGQMSSGTTLLIASRWLTTCVIAGLACAWSWQRGSY
ncbi:MAG TPA: hypothetical protein PKE27_22265 [Povalibacter sp.]|uniref:hypothetical protein n=1 Tax=Povalibacter sp. TaxID=1962978 RepID=UPI002C8274F4|nr:hypothetical protein [Povalibacter sp.]HMN47316.1 hypothetical protein [Povalibacter sp.]